MDTNKINMNRITPKCPFCKSKNTRSTNMALCSYPAQFEYECKDCHRLFYKLRTEIKEDDLNETLE